MSATHELMSTLPQSRYQYLELAYYLTYGRCPDPEEEPFILNQANFDSFQNFYKVSSELLNVRRSSLRSREVCLCVRLSLEPGDIEEQRSYVYEDDKVSSQSLCCCASTCSVHDERSYPATP